MKRKKKRNRSKRKRKNNVQMLIVRRNKEIKNEKTVPVEEDGTLQGKETTTLGSRNSPNTFRVIFFWNMVIISVTFELSWTAWRGTCHTHTKKKKKESDVNCVIILSADIMIHTDYCFGWKTWHYVKNDSQERVKGRWMQGKICWLCCHCLHSSLNKISWLIHAFWADSFHHFWGISQHHQPSWSREQAGWLNMREIFHWNYRVFAIQFFVDMQVVTKSQLQPHEKKVQRFKPSNPPMEDLR